MGKQRRQLQGIVWLLVSAFCSFLLQPQIGTLTHTHLGDEHLHIHPQLSFSPVVRHEHTHTHAHHSRPHFHLPPNEHRHSHVNHSPHAHDRQQHVHDARKTDRQPLRTSLRVASSSRSHWHPTTALHHPGLVAALTSDPALTTTVLSTATPQKFHWIPRPTYRSRAPPFSR